MRRRLLPAAGVIPALALLLLQSVAAQRKSQSWIGSFAKYSEIPGATRVGPDKCTGCHITISAGYQHAFHSQQGVDCEDCHGPASLHAQAGDTTKIVSFRSRRAEESNGACLSCHAQGEKVRHWLGGAHAANHVKCIECHQVHAGPSKTAPVRLAFDTMGPGSIPSLERMAVESNARLAPRWQINDACLKCHPTQRAQGSMPYHHPLREAKMTCVDCHDAHGGAAGNNLQTANVNQLCLGCHAQYRGPFMYQHPPVNENCMNCHVPHGSANTNLLTLNQPALCLQCHAGHHDGASLPLVDRCTNCHGSIHGTDVPTPTGGSRFVDKGGLGVPGFPQPAGTATSGMLSHRAAFATGRSHPAISFSPAAALASGLGAMFSPFSAGMFGGGGPPVGGASAADSNGGLYFTPGAYRFLNVTGYAGRVGQYDSLQQSEGGRFEGNYVSPSRRLTLLTRGEVISGSDFHVASQFNLGERLDVGADMRSFVEQQDNYPFLSGAISPDITTTDTIAPGSVFGVKRRMGNAYAKVKLPEIPVHLFVKGDWQARVGHTQLSYLDENTDSTCSSCHFTSTLQSLNYTTRSIAGGAELTLGGMDLTYEHRYSSFNDRLPFPTGSFGPMLNEVEPSPVFVPDTPAGSYYLNIPSPNRYSADTLMLNWTASPQLVFNGQVTYRRLQDVFTHNPQNGLDADSVLMWRPTGRLRITADFRQENLVNGFVPYFAFYGNVSNHQHWAGAKVSYELTKGLDLETHYRRSEISRSNAFLWPQIYSFDNSDLLPVVPFSSSNTAGLALRYHASTRWSARAGYEWTGTNSPGYLTESGSNNRLFGDFTLTPRPWLVFNSNTSIILQNAFPIIQRRNRFYTETATTTLTPTPNWNLEMGYSYQQNNLATYMAFQNDAAAGYVLDDPFAAYRQLSQTYWFQSAWRVTERLGLNLGLTHNSAHSGLRPDLNPNDYLLLGNGPLVQQGAFNQGLFQQALGALAYGSSLTQMNVPQLIAQGKLYYLLPHGFDAGFVAYYGSYRDYTTPSMNGILRAYNVYFARAW